MDSASITPPDDDARRAAIARHARLAAPLGGLGRLAELGAWLSSVQGVCPPRPPARARVVLFAAEHGIAAAGVSAHPPETTAFLVGAVRDNTAPVTVVAPAAGASVRLVDVGLAGESTDRHHVRAGSGRIDREDALTVEEVRRAVAAGRAVVDEEVDGGADLLVPGAIGVGATTPASTIVSAITGAEPVAVIGRGSGIDDSAWMRKAAAVRDALRRARPYVRDPFALLRVVGGADIAALTGFLLQAATRRTPVLVDGLVVTAAAMVADEIAGGARAWWLSTQASPEPAMTLATDHLGLAPVVDLGMRTTDGAGAVALLPLFDMAARLLAEAAALPEAEPEPAAPADAAGVVPPVRVPAPDPAAPAEHTGNGSATRPR